MHLECVWKWSPFFMHAYGIQLGADF
eukprot:SAG11_NODE_21044_length_433_cov_0.817365_1_plen_25_part_10